MSPVLRRPCPGCKTVLIASPAGRCAACEKAVNAARPADLVKFYSSTRWKRFRGWVRRARPLCECRDSRCRCEGRCHAPTVVVDHIIPLRERPDLALVETNARPMCVSCHNTRTSREQSWSRNRPVSVNCVQIPAAGAGGAVRPRPQENDPLTPEVT
jgi:5-methylcytosine-specific restriction endonuclease McrA